MDSQPQTLQIDLHKAGRPAKALGPTIPGRQVKGFARRDRSRRLESLGERQIWQWSESSKVHGEQLEYQLFAARLKQQNQGQQS